MGDLLKITGSETKIGFLLIETLSKLVIPQNHSHPELIQVATYYFSMFKQGVFKWLKT
jgi:hypothetical protein